MRFVPARGPARIAFAVVQGAGRRRWGIATRFRASDAVRQAGTLSYAAIPCSRDDRSSYAFGEPAVGTGMAFLGFVPIAALVGAVAHWGEVKDFS